MRWGGSTSESSVIPGAEHHVIIDGVLSEFRLLQKGLRAFDDAYRREDRTRSTPPQQPIISVILCDPVRRVWWLCDFCGPVSKH